MKKSMKNVARMVQTLLFAVVLTFCSCVQTLPLLTTVEISQKEAEIVVGESVELSATSSDGAAIVWTSANEKVATVSDGVVLGLGVGTVVITAATTTALDTCTVTVKSDAVPDADIADLSIVWRDEFDGTQLDTTKWDYQLGIRDDYHGHSGAKYWGNDEKQYYTKDAVSVADGSLIITAQRRDYEGMEYTSARILTRDLASFTYGYFEARMQLPTVQGMWPAFWMMPQSFDSSSMNNEYGGWPVSGELDIMEARGRKPNEVGNALHFGDYSSHQCLSDTQATETSIGEWHTYGVDWRPESITWYVDGEASFKLKNSQWWSSASDGASAPFDKPFYILLNLAVGGNYDGGRMPPEDFVSANMYVDYVRVYEHI